MAARTKSAPRANIYAPAMAWREMASFSRVRTTTPSASVSAYEKQLSSDANVSRLPSSLRVRQSSANPANTSRVKMLSLSAKMTGRLLLMISNAAIAVQHAPCVSFSTVTNAAR